MKSAIDLYVTFDYRSSEFTIIYISLQLITIIVFLILI